MRKICLQIVGVLFLFACLSWGTTGHFTVGYIADRHLNSNAQLAVKDLLGNDGLAAVSTWADDVRGEKEYKATGAWHYVNLPAGLDSVAFIEKVTNMGEDNVYKAVQKCQQDLKSTTTDRKTKTEALKFLVHFIGDLHQPMHVSHAEDRGGNSIKVLYKGDSSNLHAVWDSKLVDEEGLVYKEISDKYDTASAPQIAKWQHDALIQWLWESYQVSSVLYKEIDELGKVPNLKKRYYEEHKAIVYHRLEMAGIRLAGVLNAIFDEKYQAPPKDTSMKVEEVAKAIKIEDVANHIGEYATVCSKVYGHKDLDGLTLVNLGAAFPNHLLTVVLKGEALSTFKKLDGKEVCVTGKIIDYKGKPEIIVIDPKKLEMRDGK